MDEIDLARTLTTITYHLKGKNFPWRVDGSANLKLQGVSITVNDLDITTNADGLRLCKKALEQYGLQERYDKQKKIHSLRGSIKGIPIEINCYEDFELRMFDKVNLVSWKGHKLPLLPLEHAAKFYRKIHRLDKVDLIQKHLA